MVVRHLYLVSVGTFPDEAHPVLIVDPHAYAAPPDPRTTSLNGCQAPPEARPETQRHLTSPASSAPVDAGRPVSSGSAPFPESPRFPVGEAILSCLILPRYGTTHKFSRAHAASAPRHNRPIPETSTREKFVPYRIDENLTKLDDVCLHYLSMHGQGVRGRHRGQSEKPWLRPGEIPFARAEGVALSADRLDVHCGRFG